MRITKLDWDSDFFGYPIGKAELAKFSSLRYKELITLLHESKIKLLYIYPLDQISKHTLLENSVPLVDTKVTFIKSGIFSINACDKIKSYGTNEQFETIEKLALVSGEYSRFRTDNNFSSDEYSRLYSEWVKKSISRDIATDVLIYKDKGLIKGFVSYKISSQSELSIGLIAVEPSAHGQGIGKKLMQSVENIAHQNGIDNITVYTQLANKNANLFYYSCGYQLVKQQEIFHLWIH